MLIKLYLPSTFVVCQPTTLYYHIIVRCTTTSQTLVGEVNIGFFMTSSIELLTVINQ